MASLTHGHTSESQPGGLIATRTHQVKSARLHEITHSVCSCVFRQQWRCFPKNSKSNAATTVVTDERASGWRPQIRMASTCCDGFELPLPKKNLNTQTLVSLNLSASPRRPMEESEKLPLKKRLWLVLVAFRLRSVRQSCAPTRD